MFVDVLYLFILSMCYLFIKKEKIHKYNVKNYFLFTFITILFQFISVGTRNVEITNNNNFIIYSILDIDYLLLNIFAYKLYFLKGGKDLWVEVHSSCSDLLISLKKLPTKLQQSYQLAKPRNREEKLANNIYIVLFWLYNIFSVFVILFI